MYKCRRQIPHYIGHKAHVSHTFRFSHFWHVLCLGEINSRINYYNEGRLHTGNVRCCLSSYCIRKYRLNFKNKILIRTCSPSACSHGYISIRLFHAVYKKKQSFYPASPGLVHNPVQPTANPSTT